MPCRDAGKGTEHIAVRADSGVMLSVPKAMVKASSTACDPPAGKREALPPARQLFHVVPSFRGGQPRRPIPRARPVKGTRESFVPVMAREQSKGLVTVLRSDGQNRCPK